MIRRASLRDVGALTAIHLSAMPNALLHRLGREYLSETFYPAVFRSSETPAYVEEVDGTVVSYLVFTFSRQATQQLTSQRKPILFALLRNLFSDPSLLLELAIQLRGPEIILDGIEHPDLDTTPELFLIATLPSAQGRGYGGRLLSYALTELYRSFDQCTVRTPNPRARTFYHRHGFVDIGFEIRGKKRLWIMSHSKHR